MNESTDLSNTVIDNTYYSMKGHSGTDPLCSFLQQIMELAKYEKV